MRIVVACNKVWLLHIFRGKRYFTVDRLRARPLTGQEWAEDNKCVASEIQKKKKEGQILQRGRRRKQLQVWLRRVVLLRFLGKAPTQSWAYLHSARFRGYLLHLLFLICGMHRLKPFNILCVFGVLQILWYLGYFEVGYWFSPVHVRGVTGGLWSVWSVQWHLADAHALCSAASQGRLCSVWSGFERESAPVWIFWN